MIQTWHSLKCQVLSWLDLAKENNVRMNESKNKEEKKNTPHKKYEELMDLKKENNILIDMELQMKYFIQWIKTNIEHGKKF